LKRDEERIWQAFGESEGKGEFILAYWNKFIEGEYVLFNTEKF